MSRSAVLLPVMESPHVTNVHLFSHPESSKPLQLVDRAQLSAHISREKPRGASEVKGFLFMRCLLSECNCSLFVGLTQTGRSKTCVELGRETLKTTPTAIPFFED